MDTYITLFIVLLLAGLATLIKYLGGENLIAGYNTASPAEKKYMSDKGIGAFAGNYIYVLAGIILAGFLGKKAGFVWGESISWALFVITIIIMLIRVQRFNPPASMSTPQSIRTKKIGLWAGVIITLVVLGIVTWNALPTQFNLQANQLEITGAYGFNINYSDIEDIRLQTELPAVGMKTNGLNLGPILKGHFIVEGMGNARLFLRSTHGPICVITLKDNSNPVLINFSDPAETKLLFQQLESRTAKSTSLKGAPEESDIAAKVGNNLEIIISSPRESSNPRSYIEEHQNEYHNIIKMGDHALNYMLAQFAKGEANGLRGHIMMSLCKDILGDKNNVAEGSYSTPMEWYKKLAPYTAAKLSDFKPQTNNIREKLVYSAAQQKYSSNMASINVVAPHIFDTYETDSILKIFATVYYSSFNLYGNNLSQSSAGVVPAAIVYTKNSDSTYTFKEYIEAGDGAYFQKSIEEFCAPQSDIARAIIKHYGNYDDLRELMEYNLIEGLKQNNLTGISLKSHDGTLTPLN